MLKKRIITAVVVLSVFLPALLLNLEWLFLGIMTLFLLIGLLENFSLSRMRSPVLFAAFWTIIFLAILGRSSTINILPLFMVCSGMWLSLFTLLLWRGLPPLAHSINSAIVSLYSVSILGAFIAAIEFFMLSPYLLLSVLVVVWSADMGAYFAGKFFGRHKLASVISPGKTWEGVVGGWLMVLLVAFLWAKCDPFRGNFFIDLLLRFGWVGTIASLTLLVGVSVVGDLFESLLKRRLGVKDSGWVLPGHGGVLDRIDALISALPVAALIYFIR